MTELSRHIEILLLDNDCVIVPGFGGFMAHHKPAEFIEEEGMFYPPQRTLGFNPQLRLNDSVLAQSYIEAYDISYPEAIRKIDAEVEEVKQELAISGAYEFHGIGTVSLHADGRYIFEPCASGLLTPSLYALNSCAFEMLEDAEEKNVTAAVATGNAEPAVVSNLNDTPATVNPVNNDEGEEAESSSNIVEMTYDEYEDDVIRISLPLFRKIVAAAILLLMIVFNSIPAGKGSNNVSTCSMIDTELISSMVSSVNNNGAMQQKIQQTDKADSASIYNKVEEHDTYYAIILASKISRRGAEYLIEQLKNAGLPKGEMRERNNMRQVTYGRYESMEKARQDLRTIRNTRNDMDEAWITEVKN